ncbi:MAG: hypothetical protein QOI56_1600, partial [Actinomycetota bacterium]|nr:hypothetical protein [Actinomycetota bacterium]
TSASDTVHTHVGTREAIPPVWPPGIAGPPPPATIEP